MHVFNEQNVALWTHLLSIWSFAKKSWLWENFLVKWERFLPWLLAQTFLVFMVFCKQRGKHLC